MSWGAHWGYYFLFLIQFPVSHYFPCCWLEQCALLLQNCSDAILQLPQGIEHTAHGTVLQMSKSYFMGHKFSYAWLFKLCSHSSLFADKWKIEVLSPPFVCLHLLLSGLCCRWYFFFLLFYLRLSLSLLVPFLLLSLLSLNSSLLKPFACCLCNFIMFLWIAIPILWTSLILSLSINSELLSFYAQHWERILVLFFPQSSQNSNPLARYGLMWYE